MADENGSEERETSLYLTQIQYLDKKLERCQLKCDELEKQNKNLGLLCKALEEEETDPEFLKRFMAEKEKEVDELAVKLEAQRQAAERTLKELKLQKSLELEELQEQVDKLNSQMRKQAAQSEEKQQQKKQLEQQLCDFASLEKKLLREEKKHKAVIKDLERDVLSEIISTALERRNTLKDWSKARISEIVQEEMAQHGELDQQLQEVLKEIQNLQAERAVVKRKEYTLSSEIEALEAAAAVMEQDMTTIQKNTEKLTEMKERLEMRKKNCDRICESIVVQLDLLCQQLDTAKEEYLHKTNMVAQLEAELKEERTRRAVLEDDMKKAVIVLRHVLEASGEAVGTLLSQDLLRILERNLPEGDESTLRDSIETRSGARKPQTSDSESERAETLDLASDPLFLLARCRPGDFGLIPRPSWALRPL